MQFNGTHRIDSRCDYVLTSHGRLQ